MKSLAPSLGHKPLKTTPESGLWLFAVTLEGYMGLMFPGFHSCRNYGYTPTKIILGWIISSYSN